MNERIQQLMHQCYIENSQDRYDMEKFAELIINDARLVLCGEAFVLGAGPGSAAVLAGSTKVKEHFGVK